MKTMGVMLGLGVLLAWSGCAGYRLGSTGGLVPDAKSVEVAFFKNETFEPRLVTDVKRSLSVQLQQDGTYQLETQGKGDLIVYGILKDFRRNGVTYKPTDILTVQDYSLSLTAQVTVTERATGKILLDRSFTGETTIKVGNDLASGERQARPLIAEVLARRAMNLIVDGDWDEVAASDEEDSVAP